MHEKSAKDFNCALITGATSGIGMALAKLLAAEGISLILTGRNEKQLQLLARELPVEVQTITADLSDSGERVRVVAAIRQMKPQLVINNAGQGLYGEAAENEVAKQMQMLEVNVNALQELTLEAIKALKAAGKTGTIMNISSAAAFQIFPYFAVYSATKVFVNHLSESLNAETTDYGIHVLAACPGMVATNFRARSGGRTSEEERKYFMTADFAAREIWKQILSGKAVRTFDWKYRILAFLSGLMPKPILARILKRHVRSYVEK